MINLLKNTYLLKTKEIKKEIELFWIRYQKILQKRRVSWADLNEARAILYFLGYLYPEKIALTSLIRRVKCLKPKISLVEFLSAIDRDNQKIISKYKNNKKFNQLKEFYLVVKSIKNREKNNSYLDEDNFNRLYEQKRPKDYF